MASAVPSGSTGRPCPEGLTWWRAGCGKTARPVREGRGLGNRPLTFIAFVAVVSTARCLQRHGSFGGKERGRERSPRGRLEVRAVAFAALQMELAGGGDHRGVVGAEAHRRERDPQAACFRRSAHL